jgi:hypothetical protein
MNNYWTLNGHYLEEFKGLSEENIKKLEYKGEINGIKIFTSNKIPIGTLRLYEGNICRAEITGIKGSIPVKVSQTKRV